MTPLIAWGATTLGASTLLMLLVLAVRAPARRWLGPRPAYALWALPALRMILPPLPALFPLTPLIHGAADRLPLLLVGPATPTAMSVERTAPGLEAVLLAIWLVGAVGLFTVYALRHLAFCRQLRTHGVPFGRAGDVFVLAAEVPGPLAFGVVRRFVAVPRRFAQDYSAQERDLALAHEYAHHARGDLVANWVLLLVLAAHWWNPVAWIAMRAFRQDQEFAADAHVMAARDPAALPLYAQVLAKAAGIGAPPACNLNARSNLKGRLIMLRHSPPSRPRLLFGAAILASLGGAALAATVATPSSPGGVAGRQAVTIGVRPDGSGGFAYVVGDRLVAPGAPLPGGLTLPADFSGTGGCDVEPDADASAMVIKGAGTTETYTVMCASGRPVSIRATLAEGLASLNTMRASVATQPATQAFPEAERTHALGAIDRSVQEVEAILARPG